jgi:AraC family transcriptional regulator
MNPTVSQPLSAVQYPQALPIHARVSAAWSAFAAHVVDVHADFSETLTFADHVLSLRLSGTCRLRQTVGRRSLFGRSGPGSMNVIPAHLAAKWEASAMPQGSRTITFFVPETFLARVVEQSGMDSRKIEIIPQFLTHDPVMESVLTRLAIEAQTGSPSGQLYAESACEFLAHHLIHAYSSRSTPLPRWIGGLSGRHLQAVLDYIEECLAEPLTFRQLAQLAGVSPRHFERAFRQAVGVPLHAYVMTKRVAAARSLLVSEPTLRIDQIAARVGFCSSSHLASAFRRHTGYSPAGFRRIHTS